MRLAMSLSRPSWNVTGLTRFDQGGDSRPGLVPRVGTPPGNRRHVDSSPPRVSAKHQGGATGSMGHPHFPHPGIELIPFFLL